METDKDLLRQGRYSEALGDNYDYTPYHILLFKDGFCVEDKALEYLEINKTYATRQEAKRCVYLMTKRNKLPKNMWYTIYNTNSDWL